MYFSLSKIQSEDRINVFWSLRNVLGFFAIQHWVASPWYLILSSDVFTVLDEMQYSLLCFLTSKCVNFTVSLP